MLPLIFTTPLYTTIFVVVIVCSRIPEAVSTSWWRSHRGPTAQEKDRGSLIVLGIFSGGGVIGALVLSAVWLNAAVPWYRLQLFSIGIVVYLIGIALRFWAIVTLGRAFTTKVMVDDTQAVVQTGPYRVVRHPAYSGILISLLGVSLVLANWASLVAMLVGGVIGLLYRIKVEERALVEGLGQPYIYYMRHTWRFIPFIF